MNDLARKIEIIQGASSAEEAFEYFNKAMDDYGYNNNCYTLMTDHASINQKAFHGLATTYPQDWLDHYNEKEYQKFDPVWERLLSRATPFFWNDAVEAHRQRDNVTAEQLKLAKKVMDEGADAGVTDGIGMSFVNILGEIVGIGLSREKSEKKNDYRDLAEVYLISSAFHETYLGFYQKTQLPDFSDREKEVLLWSAEGKTDWEIGQILSISVPTVRFHWKNIFTKMQVNSKTFATMLAIRHKIITPQLIRTTYQK